MGGSRIACFLIGVAAGATVFAAILLLPGCGSSSRPSEPLPPLPAVKLASFQKTIRAEVEDKLEALESDPENPSKNGDLAKLLHAHQENAAAETLYDRARILDPGRFEWPYLLASVQADQGKDEAAITNLERSLVIDSSYGPAMIKLADLRLKTGDLPGAEKQYRNALDRDPRSALAWYGLGRVQAAAGNLEAAAKSLGKAISLYPNYGQAHYALAIALRKLHRIGEARQHFALGEKHKLEMPPSGDRVLTAVRRLTRSPTEYLRAGVELDKQGKLREALAAHLEVLKIDPNQQQAHVNLISLYGRLGQPGKALEHYRKAMALNKNLPDAHYNYGVLLFSLKKYDEAAKAFERAIEINPFYAKAYCNLGILLEAKGRLDGAAAEFRKAIENKPDYRLAHFELGRVLANQGRNREALAHFEKTITIDDQDTPRYLYAVGIAHARNGNWNQALKYLREAKQRASRLDQWSLIASIDKDLAKLAERAPSR